MADIRRQQASWPPVEFLEQGFAMAQAAKATKAVVTRGEHPDHPEWGEWRVEIDYGYGVGAVLFDRPDGEERAREYAAWWDLMNGGKDDNGEAVEGDGQGAAGSGGRSGGV